MKKMIIMVIKVKKLLISLGLRRFSIIQHGGFPLLTLNAQRRQKRGSRMIDDGEKRTTIVDLGLPQEARVIRCCLTNSGREALSEGVCIIELCIM